MTQLETVGPGGERTGVQLATADTGVPGIATVLVITTKSLLPGRRVRATDCGAGALTTQQSLPSFWLGKGTGVSWQQLCCLGIGAAIQTTTGATINIIRPRSPLEGVQTLASG
jgi:hypothetical protein